MSRVLKLESDSSRVHEVGALSTALVALESAAARVLQASTRGWGAAQVHGKAPLEAERGPPTPRCTCSW